jgi:hypothetical protein
MKGVNDVPVKHDSVSYVCQQPGAFVAGAVHDQEHTHVPLTAQVSTTDCGTSAAHERLSAEESTLGEEVDLDSGSPVYIQSCALAAGYALITVEAGMTLPAAASITHVSASAAHERLSAEESILGRKVDLDSCSPVCIQSCALAAGYAHITVEAGMTLPVAASITHVSASAAH